MFRGGGGPDRVTLYDGPGDDTLRSHSSRVELAGSGFRFEAREVERAYVHATAGGTDTAFLHDSRHDDVLSVRPEFTSLRGGGTFQSAYGFDRVYAYATAGGNDTAELYDSGGDDTMSITAQRSILSSAGYRASVRGFDSVIAQAVFGGDDLVRIYADASASDWDTADGLVQWTGNDGAIRAARGFERAFAFERFEPIELTTQSALDSPSEWFSGSRGETHPRDLEARRAIFRSLGQTTRAE